MYIRVRSTDSTVYEYDIGIESGFSGLSQLDAMLHNNSTIWAHKINFDPISGKHYWRSD